MYKQLIYAVITVFVIVEKAPLTKSLEVLTRGCVVSPFDCHVDVDAGGNYSDADTQDEDKEVEGIPLHVRLPPQEPEVEERWEHKGQHRRGETPHQSKAQLKTGDSHCHTPRDHNEQSSQCEGHHGTGSTVTTTALRTARQKDRKE